MQNEIRRLLSCLIIVLSVLLSSFFMGFDSKASIPEFYVDYAEPNSSDNQGYMVLLLENQNEGYRRVATYFWNTLGVTSSSAESQTYGYIDLTHTTLSFTIAGTGSLNSVYYNFNEINTDGVYKMVKASTTERTNLNFGESGWRIIGYQYKGAVQVNTGMQNQVFRINFNTDGSAILLQSQLSTLMDIKNLNIELRYRLERILNASVSIEEKIEQLKVIENEQNALLQESNTWLQKIWTSIQRLFKGDNVEDDAKVDEFGDTTTQQSDKISDLQEQNKVEKVDTDSASSSVDSNIDAEEIGNFGTVLTVFTGDTHILQYILIVLSVALISYVLFGKR